MEKLIVFKEWSLVCDALLKGKQHLILRKGGIAEGREGFAFKHENFHLFPTRFHEQEKLLNYSPADDWEEVGPETDKPGSQVTIQGRCQMVGSAVLTDWAQIEKLASFHVWKESVIRDRFDYNDQGSLHLALIRAYVLNDPWVFPYEKRLHGGCRSWLNLEAQSLPRDRPVCPEETFEASIQEMKDLLGDSLETSF